MSREDAHMIEPADHILRPLFEGLDPSALTVDSDQLTLLSQDLSYKEGKTALAAVRPRSVEELARAVRLASDAGAAVVPRAGGLSYTGGYTHTADISVVIDMSAMNRIITINSEDMYVVVETGCTWKTLYEALAPLKLRTPYFGPLSGAYATVGGAISQNSLFHGSGTNGTVADSVLGLKVVLSDGSVLTTGSAGATNGKPFFRHFGPDITGLFTSDTGAFGIKAEATLRLIPFPAATEYLSFAFDSLNEMLRAQTELCRLGVASECYGFDPFYNRAMEANGIDFNEGISKLGQIARKGGIAGLGRAAKVALNGKRMLRNVLYSLHMTIDGATSVVAQEHAKLADEICLREGGTTIANSIPTVFRNAPFGGIRSLLLGPDGEVFLPVHGFFPMSDATTVAEKIEGFFAQHRKTMEKWEISNSYLTCFARNAFFIEPIFFWKDALGDFRLSLLDPDQAELWRDRPAAVDRRGIVLDLRSKLYGLFEQLGGIQMQSGKYYDFMARHNSDAGRRVLTGLKDVLDPKGSMNPGSLGLTKPM